MTEGSIRGSKGFVDVNAYKTQIENMAKVRKGFQEAMAAQNGFHMSQVQVQTQTNALTESLKNQKLSLSGAVKNWKQLGAVYKEQMALRNSFITSWTESNGKINADMMIPKDLSSKVKSFRTELGFMSQVLSSASENTIKWGKNTQWAGRQLTVGFTVPLLAAAAATGVMAFQIDKSLTQIVKVYGDVNSANKTSTEQIRADSMATAKTVAQAYGQSAKDTLDITAQLAASGKTGNDLQEATIAVTRARMLGELNLQDAIKATITLQSVYGDSAKGLTKDFDYMNAMENATVLTMQDFVEGIPRAAGILNTLGGTLQDLGTLLTAFKAGGIDAAEGANAIKSIAFKVLKPTAGAISEFSKDTGKDLEAIVKGGGSDLVQILIDISTAMRGLDSQKQASIFKSLFGIYQGSKAATAMMQLANATGQVGTAMDIASQSADQWAKVSAQEVVQQTQSLSGQFKRMVASIQVDLANIGQTALKMAIPVLGVVHSILEAFNNLPEGAKKFGLVAAVILALVGPVVMLTGLMANMIGTVGKFVSTIGILTTRFKIMDEETRAQILLQKSMTNVWDTQSAAVSRLTAELQLAADAMGGLAREQILARQGSMATSSMYQSASGGLYMARPGQKPKKASKADITEARNLAHEQALVEAPLYSGRVLQDTAKTEGLWSKIGKHAGLIGVAAFGMASMVSSSGSLLNNIMNIAVGASLIGSTKMGQKLAKNIGSGIGNVVTSAMGALGGSKAGGAVARAFTGAKSAIGTLLPVAGAAAGSVAAIGLAAGLVYIQTQKAMAKTRQEIQKTDDSAKDWANILGFAYTEAGAKVDSTGKKVNALTDTVNKFKDANKDAAAEFKKMNDEHASDQEKLNAAIQEGVKIVNHGGTAAQAMEAAKAALVMMGSKLSESDMELKIKAVVNFDSDQSVLEAQARGIVDNIQQAVDNKVKQSKWEGFARIFTGSDDMNAGGGQKIKDVAKEMWTTFGNASDAQKKKVFDQLASAADKDANDLFTRLQKQYGNAFSRAGITNTAQLIGFNGDLGRGGPNTPGLGLSSKDMQDVTRMQAAMQSLIKQFGSLANVPADQLAKVFDFKDLDKYVLSADQATAGTVSLADAQAQYKTAVDSSTASGEKQDEATKLATLNYYRHIAGLDDATSSQQGFAGSVVATTAAINSGTDAITGYNSKLLTMSDAASATDTLKSVFSGAMNDVYSGAASIMQDQLSARMDSIQAGADRWNANFSKKQDAWNAKWTKINDHQKDLEDRRQKQVTAAYDKRIAAVDKAIKAEQDADAIRQKIFDAEKTRIQRMSEMFGKNIDFNSALNSGQLDQAAKIQNDIMATQQGWNVEDAQAASGNASQGRQDALSAQKDKLNKQKDAALAHLKVVDRAEENALKKTEDRQKAALAAEKARYDAGTKAAQAAATRQNAINQRALDAQLNTLKAYTPRNEAELKAHIARVQAAYAKYGINLQAQGTGWGKIVGSALQNNVAVAAAALRDKIAWDQIGKTIADEMVAGAFSLTMSQFTKWIKTGELPTGGLSNSTQVKGGYRVMSGPNKGKVLDLNNSRHSGGVIGDSLGRRTGHSGGQSQSEVFINALKGEGVVSQKGMQRIGPDGLDAINNGKGGPGLGVAGLMAGAMAGAVKNAMNNQIIAAGVQQIDKAASYSMPGAAGMYGNTNLDAAQLANAAKIIGVGRSMGATQRDLIVSIMTALQESTLRNLSYGDRDSVGLFQQRAGWGSVAERMNPAIAARKFFEALFKVKNRNALPLTLEAQAVQRSAFPQAYAKWEDEARAIVLGGSTSGLASSPGGLLRPTNGRVSSEYGYRTNPITGRRELHNGIDLASPLGTPIHATQTGRVALTAPTSSSGGYGNYTVIQHASGLRSGYGHQSRFGVRAGQNVSKGQVIGLVGSTGLSTGPHLHFQLGYNGNWQNPRSIFPGLREGGHTLNTGLANLHPRETVLTEPLSRDFKRGVENFANGGGDTYQFGDIIVEGPVSNDYDLQKGLEKGMAKVKRRQGLNRRIK